MDDFQPWPKEETGVYVVSRLPWEREPTTASDILYVGSNSQNPELFLRRVGDLIIDMLGFWGHQVNSGHHAGGQTLWLHCYENKINPLDLFLGWQHRIPCARCAELESYLALSPRLAKKTPARCHEHQS